MEAIVQCARAAGDSLFGALLDIDRIEGAGTKAKKGIKEFVRIMSDLMSIAETERVSIIVNEVLERTGYLDQLEKDGGEESFTMTDST